MTEEQLLSQIEVNPMVVAGKPVIKGTRLQVALILRLLGRGATVEEILEDYDWIEKDDIRACLLFAEKVMDDITFMPLMAETTQAIPDR